MARYMAATGTAGVVSAAASAGRVGALVLIVTVLAVLGAGCWILATSPRTQRLNSVIKTVKTPAGPLENRTKRNLRRHLSG